MGKSAFCCSTLETGTFKVRGIPFSKFPPLLERDCAVEEGDRIAQLVLERIVTPEVLEVEVRFATAQIQEA